MIMNGKMTLLAGLLIPGVALAQIDVGAELGNTETAIRAALQAQGYTTTEFELEDGVIEVEAENGQGAFEFEVSQETGLVLAAHAEDEDDDAEDDDDDDDDDDDEEEQDDEDKAEDDN